MKRFFLCVGLFLSTATGWAQTTVPNTFTAGTRASAAAVNENFTALTNAIDQLAVRVTSLEGAITAADVVGTYSVNGLEHDVNSGSIGVEGVTWGGTLTFASGGGVGSGTFTWAAATNHHVLELGVNTSGPPNHVPSLDADRTNETNSEPIEGTWSISGNEVTLLIDVDGNPTEFVAYFIPNAHLFVMSWSNDAEYSNALLVGVRR